MQRTDLRRTLGAWLPVALWSAVIWQLGGDGFSDAQTQSSFGPWLEWLLPWLSSDDRLVAGWMVRRAAHPTIYGVLAGLSWRALNRGAGRLSFGLRAGLALVVTLAVAMGDEGHQAGSEFRDGSAMDVGLNLAGGLAMVAGLALLERRLGRRLFVSRTED